MTSSSSLITGLESRRRVYVLAVPAACVAAAGVLAQDVTAYFCVAIPALAPLFVWLRAGTPGIPVLPAISGVFYIYYALPLLRTDIAAYGSEELVQAGATVGSFLLAAALASIPFLHRSRRDAGNGSRNFVTYAQINKLVFVGLSGGIVFQLATISNDLSWLGNSIGLVRSIVLTLSSIACYLLGYARASGSLVGVQWALSVSALFLLIVLTLSNLLLVGGVMNILAAILGYVVTGKRIPWIILVVTFAVLSVLHAGKFEMRKTYWLPHSQSLAQTSVFMIPGMMAEWLYLGVASLASPDSRESGVLERASLLHMLLLTQRATPGIIPYLEGQTYALLPDMLVPRFIDPEKPESQAVLNMLSIRYGLQNAESATSTTIGWGMVAEAWANYGYLAVISIGAVFGALCGALIRLSAGAAPLSPRMFVTIASTLVLLNLELDFSYLMVTLLQTIAAILISTAIPHLLAGRGRMSEPPIPVPPGTNESPFEQAPSR